MTKMLSDFVVFDLETTGLSPASSEIIEIGAVKISGGRIVGTFSSFVLPTYSIPAQATKINGITDKMVQGAPTIDIIIPQFASFVGNNVLIGHNIAKFDMYFLQYYSGNMFKNRIIDTLTLAEQCLPNMKHNMERLCKYYNIGEKYDHRALSDSLITYKCFRKLIQDCVAKGIPIYMKEAPIIPNCGCNIKPATNPGWSKKRSASTLALRELTDTLLTITDDGVLTCSELTGLKKWMDDHRSLDGNYPFDAIFHALTRVLEDGFVSTEESELLMKLFAEFTNPVECAEHDKLCGIDGKHCVITGDFKFGHRTKVEEYICSRGGIMDNNVKKCTDYVIVGALGSDAWANGNYGNKVKKALEYQEKGVSIAIIKEEDFFKEIK